VNQKMGAKATADFYRLFVVPGMGHCFGGAGANAFGQPFTPNGPNPADPGQDILSALDAWVVKGRAPSQIVATKYPDDDPSKGVAFQRPLCTYPRVARYTGKGDPKAASSFACVQANALQNAAAGSAKREGD